MFFKKKMPSEKLGSELALWFAQDAARVAFLVDNRLNEFSLEAETYNPNASHIRWPVLRYIWTYALSNVCKVALLKWRGVGEEAALSFASGSNSVVERVGDKGMLQPDFRTDLKELISHILEYDEPFQTNGYLRHDAVLSADKSADERQGVAYSIAQLVYEGCIEQLEVEDYQRNGILISLATEFEYGFRSGADFCKRVRIT